jgi:capsid assembly protease
VTTNPLLSRFAGAAAAAFVAFEMQGQLENCLVQAHSTMQTPEFVQAQAAHASSDFWAFEPDSYMARLRPYVVKNGILQIPVKGVLLHDFPYAVGSWATGYDYIWRAFERGMGDLNVKGIAFVVDSPGGEVAGNFDAVDRMYALKTSVGKPVRGYAAEYAYSAAYSIISLCDTITVSRTGGVGSIGVVTGHLDVSGAMDKAGLKFTFIYAGQHKVDGNPYEPLPKDVKDRIQVRIDALYDVFVSTVARNRGMDEQAIRDTEALTFTAQEALSNGLADSIGALDDALADYAADLSPDEGDETMSTTSGAVDQAAHETAVAAARAEGVNEGRAAGLKDGATAERSRISAILASDEGKDRPKAALSAALKTDLSVEAAVAFIADLPKEGAVAASAAVVEPAPHAQPGFAGAMASTKNPNVGVEASTEGGPAADPDSPESTLAAARAFGIAGLRPARSN